VPCLEEQWVQHSLILLVDESTLIDYMQNEISTNSGQPKITISNGQVPVVATHRGDSLNISFPSPAIQQTPSLNLEPLNGERRLSLMRNSRGSFLQPNSAHSSRRSSRSSNFYTKDNAASSDAIHLHYSDRRPSDIIISIPVTNILRSSAVQAERVISTVNFEPELHDELKINAGDTLLVLRQFEDGSLE
jgi:hypothetical protein